MSEKKENEKINPVIITPSAFKKLETIATIMQDLEFRVCSLSLPNENYIYDFYIPNQTVGNANVSSEKHEFGQEDFAIRNLGYKLIGIAHGHGSFAVNHSSIDHNNMDKPLMSWGYNNLERIKSNLTIWNNIKSGDEIIKEAGGEYMAELIIPSSLNDILYEHGYDIKNALSIITAERSYISSIVINRFGEIEVLKRYMVEKIIHTPEELENFSERGDFPEYAIQQRKNYRYTEYSTLEIQEGLEEIDLNLGTLEDELNQKIQTPTSSKLYLIPERKEKRRSKLFPWGTKKDKKQINLVDKTDEIPILNDEEDEKIDYNDTNQSNISKLVMHSESLKAEDVVKDYAKINSFKTPYDELKTHLILHAYNYKTPRINTRLRILDNPDQYIFMLNKRNFAYINKLPEYPMHLKKVKKMEDEPN